MKFQDFLDARNLSPDDIQAFKHGTSEDQLKVINNVSPGEINQLVTALENVYSIKINSLSHEVVKAIDLKQNISNREERYIASKLIKPSKVWYRGSVGDFGAKCRPGYAVYLTDNIYQAATYAGKSGVINEITLAPHKVELMNNPDDSFDSASAFDRVANDLAEHDALLVYNVSDPGPHEDGIIGTDHVKRSENVAIKSDKIAKVIKTYKSNKFFV